MKLNTYKLQDLLINKGIGLYKLSELSGVSPRTVARIMAGRTKTRLTTIKKIVDALGVTPSELRA